MSSKPSVQGVKEVINLLKIQGDIMRDLNNAQIYANQIPNLTERHRITSQKIIETMESMDLRSSGNAGWENRISWFLAELVRQIMDKQV